MLQARAGTRLTLEATTAADLMRPNPLSIRDTATVHEALVSLTGHDASAAAVLDKTGRPVGVLSRTDLLVHEREQINAKPPTATADAEQTRVRDLMTPVVISVRPDTPAHEVIQQLVQMNVERLFVVDGSGALVGVVSALDVLRRLHFA
jgi:CBS domain-containing protein